MEGEKVDFYDLKSEELESGSSHYKIGLELYGLKEYRQSLDFNLKAFEIYRNIYGDDERPHAELADVLNNLGNNYSRLNDPQKGLEYNWKSYEMRVRLFGENSIHLVKSFNGLGLGYFFTHQYKDALEKFQQMLDRLFSEGYSDRLAYSLNAVGICYSYLGDFNKALDYKTKALEMRERIFASEDNDDLAQSLNNVGCSYGRLSQHQLAFDYKIKGLDMRKRIFSGDSLSLARSLNNVGVSYALMGDNELALKYLTISMEMRKRIYLSTDHESLVVSYKNLAKVYSKLEPDCENEAKFRLLANEMHQRLNSN